MIRCLWSPKPPMASLFTLEVVHRSHSKDTLGCWTGICADVRTEQKENTIILTGDGMGLAMVTIFAGRSTRLADVSRIQILMRILTLIKVAAKVIILGHIGW